MDTRDVFLVDAFTDEPLAGNAAGVVPEAAGLDETQMQAIASELGASETAVVLESETADRKLRFFTPEAEVDLCGHATVATYALLFERDRIEAGESTVETAAGVLDIEVTPEGMVWQTQDTPTVEPVDVSHGAVAEALGIDVAALEDVGADLPMARVSTGLPFLVVPVNFLEHLGDASPDLTAVADLSERLDVAGVYAFTFDTLDAESTAHARAFAPAAGIPEDPVTGTASGACGAYLRHHGTVEETEMRFEQGHFLDRPGIVTVRTDDKIAVGGRAVTALEGSLVVPASEDDDIIEA